MRHPRLRLRAGLGPLERWSAHSRQSVRNAVYRALFAIGDGSVFRVYRTLRRPSSGEVQVDVRDDTVVTVRMAERDAFDIVYIGDPQEAPDLGRGTDPPP
ncbi:MAG TPA: DUF6235 family protein [Mycobacteriales bacterium]|nr:DUF6235 family protein [Mycobacteriales bacterium]